MLPESTSERSDLSFTSGDSLQFHHPMLARLSNDKQSSVCVVADQIIQHIARFQYDVEFQHILADWSVVLHKIEGEVKKDLQDIMDKIIKRQEQQKAIDAFHAAANGVQLNPSRILRWDGA
ncbi:unnamed protein product [Sympodiomycopsis kandeliae]